MTDKTAKYRQEIQQMMYVSGETAEASSETTGMIEEIVRQQVIEMVCHPSSSTRVPLWTILTHILATTMHRTSLSPRLTLHLHRRPNLPHPTRHRQSLPTPHISLLERRPQERQGQRRQRRRHRSSPNRRRAHSSTNPRRRRSEEEQESQSWSAVGGTEFL
jgi:hypothetical protein